MPLPGTRVIHRDFSPHHEPVAESAMTSTVTITRRPTTAGTLNPATGAVTNPPTVLYTDLVARVQSTGGTFTRQGLSGDQVVTQAPYLVQLPSDTTGLLVDDLVTVTAATDQNLTGRTLRVTEITYGSEGFTLDLLCKDDLG